MFKIKVELERVGDYPACADCLSDLGFASDDARLSFYRELSAPAQIDLAPFLEAVDQGGCQCIITCLAYHKATPAGS